MSKAFNLTAQINLRGPTNLKPIISQIKKELSGIDANLNVKIDSKASRSIDGVNKKLEIMNKALITSQGNVTRLNAALTQLSSTFNVLNSSSNKTSASVSSVSNSVRTTSKSLKEANSLLEDFGKQGSLAVKRFAAFSVATGAVFGLINAVRQGFQEFINFDKQLVRLQQVTDSSAIGLKSLSSEITNLSKNLGVASSDLAQVAVTLAQAGLSANETRIALSALAKSELAPSFENLSKTTEGAIAAMRQFGIGARDLEAVLGSINAVASKFAVESGDLIAAIQRTGGVFASASKGVSEGKNALNEFIAVFTSVRATTRESAETIATGLRTIFTRVQRSATIELLKEFGIELQDLEGKFVGPYEAIRKLSEGLSGLDPRDIRFTRIVEELGGFRQIGKVIPLLQQFRTAQDALVAAQGGQKSLYKDQITAQQSLANQIARVREQFLALIRDVGQSNTFNFIFKSVLSLTSGIIKLGDSLKGLFPIIAVLGTIKGIGALSQVAKGFGKGLGLFGGASAGSTTGNASGTATGPGNTAVTNELKQAVDALTSNTSSLNKLTVAVDNLSTIISSTPLPLTKNNGGRISAFASGGVVPGSGNRDTVPAMLTPGEFVIRKKAVETIGAGNLQKMNKYASGGTVAGGGSKYNIIGASYVPETEEYTLSKEANNAFTRKNRFNAKDEVSYHFSQKDINVDEEYKNDTENPLYTSYISATNASKRGKAFERIVKAKYGTAFEPSRNPTSYLDGILDGRLAEIKSNQDVSQLNLGRKLLAASIAGTKGKSKEKTDQEAGERLNAKQLTSEIDTIDLGSLTLINDVSSGLGRIQKAKKALGGLIKKYGIGGSILQTDTIGAAIMEETGNLGPSIIPGSEIISSTLKDRKLSDEDLANMEKRLQAIFGSRSYNLVRQGLDGALGENVGGAINSRVVEMMNNLGLDLGFPGIAEGASGKFLTSLNDGVRSGIFEAVLNTIKNSGIYAVAQSASDRNDYFDFRDGLGEASRWFPSLKEISFVDAKKSLDSASPSAIARKIGNEGLRVAGSMNLEELSRMAEEAQSSGDIKSALRNAMAEAYGSAAFGRGTVIPLPGTDVVAGNPSLSEKLGAIYKNLGLSDEEGNRIVKQIFGTATGAKWKGNAISLGQSKALALGGFIQKLAGGGYSRRPSKLVPQEKGMLSPSPFDISQPKTDYYSLLDQYPVLSKEFDSLAYFAKNNNFSLQEFERYLQQRVQYKQQHANVRTNVSNLADQLKAPERFANGGSAEDTVPALLTPGEFVINKKAAARIGSAQLNRLNKADKIQGFNKGGSVGFVQRFMTGGDVFDVLQKDSGQSVKAFTKTLQDEILALSQGLIKGLQDAKKGFVIDIGKARAELAAGGDETDIRENLSSSLGTIGASVGITDPAVINKAIDDVVNGLKNNLSIEDIRNSSNELNTILQAQITNQDALDQSIQNLALSTGIATDKLRDIANVKNLEQKQFAESSTGKQFGALAQFSGVEKFAQSKIGSKLVGASKFMSGEGDSRASKLLGKAGGVAGVGAALSVGTGLIADQLKGISDKFGLGLSQSTTFAGVTGSLQQAGATGASAAVLGTQIAGPVGGLIAGVGGAIIGGIEGYFAGVNKQFITNTLNEIGKSGEKLDYAFQQLDKQLNQANITSAVQQFGNVLTDTAKLDTLAFGAEGLTAGDIGAGAGITATAAATGAGLGAVIGSAVPVLGTAIGAAVGGAIGAIGGAAYSYLNAPSASARKEAFEARAGAATQNIESAQRLASMQFEVQSFDELQKGLKDVETNGAKASETVKVYEKALLEAATKNGPITQAKEQEIKQTAQETAAIDAYIAQRKKAGADISTIEREIKEDRDIAVAAGENYIVQNEALARQQQLNAKASRAVAAAMEDLSAKFNKVTAFAKALDDTFGLIEKSLDIQLANISGELTSNIGTIYDEILNKINNLDALSPEEYMQVASGVTAGQGAEGQQLLQAAASGKILQDQLKPLLRTISQQGVEEQDIPGVSNKVRKLITDLIPNADNATIDNVLEQFESRLETGATSLEELSDSFGPLLSASTDAQNAIKALAETSRNAAQTQANILQKQNELLVESTNLRRQEAKAIRDSRLNYLRATGQSIPLSEIMGGFDEQIRTMTERLVPGGTTDPTQIGAEIRFRQEQNERLREINDNLGRNAATNPNANAQMMANQQIIADNDLAIREGNDALNEIANNTDAASAALDKIREGQEKAQAATGLIDKVFSGSMSDQFSLFQELQTVQAGVLAAQTGNYGAAPFGDMRFFSEFMGSEALNIFGPEQQRFLRDFAREAAAAQSGYPPEIINWITSQANQGDVQSPEFRAYQQLTERQLAAINEMSIQNEQALLKTADALSAVFTTFEQRYPQIVFSAYQQIARNAVAAMRVGNRPLGRASGGIVYASEGTLVNYEPRGTDTVPAMLTPGEFVVNAQATKKNRGLLEKINNGEPMYAARGGIVYAQTGLAVPIDGRSSYDENPEFYEAQSRREAQIIDDELRRNFESKTDREKIEIVYNKALENKELEPWERRFYADRKTGVSIGDLVRMERAERANEYREDLKARNQPTSADAYSSNVDEKTLSRWLLDDMITDMTRNNYDMSAASNPNGFTRYFNEFFNQKLQEPFDLAPPSFQDGSSLLYRWNPNATSPQGRELNSSAMRELNKLIKEEDESRSIEAQAAQTAKIEAEQLREELIKKVYLAGQRFTNEEMIAKSKTIDPIDFSSTRGSSAKGHIVGLSKAPVIETVDKAAEAAMRRQMITTTDFGEAELSIRGQDTEGNFTRVIPAKLNQLSNESLSQALYFFQEKLVDQLANQRAREGREAVTAAQESLAQLAQYLPSGSQLAQAALDYFDFQNKVNNAVEEERIKNLPPIPAPNRNPPVAPPTIDDIRNFVDPEGRLPFNPFQAEDDAELLDITSPPIMSQAQSVLDRRILPGGVMSDEAKAAYKPIEAGLIAFNKAAIPTLAAMGGAAGLGLAAPATILGAGLTIGGAIAAGMTASEIQEMLLNNIIPEQNEEMNRLMAENPMAATIGSFIPGLFAPGSIGSNTLRGRGIQAGIGAGFSVGADVINDQDIDWRKAGLSAGFAAAAGRPAGTRMPKVNPIDDFLPPSSIDDLTPDYVPPRGELEGLGLDPTTTLDNFFDSPTPTTPRPVVTSPDTPTPASLGIDDDLFSPGPLSPTTTPEVRPITTYTNPNTGQVSTRGEGGRFIPSEQPRPPAFTPPSPGASGVTSSGQRVTWTLDSQGRGGWRLNSEGSDIPGRGRLVRREDVTPIEINSATEFRNQTVSNSDPGRGGFYSSAPSRTYEQGMASLRKRGLSPKVKLSAREMDRLIISAKKFKKNSPQLEAFLEKRIQMYHDEYARRFVGIPPSPSSNIVTPTPKPSSTTPTPSSTAPTVPKPSSAKPSGRIEIGDEATSTRSGSLSEAYRVTEQELSPPPPTVKPVTQQDLTIESTRRGMETGENIQTSVPLPRNIPKFSNRQEALDYMRGTLKRRSPFMNAKGDDWRFKPLATTYDDLIKNIGGLEGLEPFKVKQLKTLERADAPLIEAADLGFRQWSGGNLEHARSGAASDGFWDWSRGTSPYDIRRNIDAYKTGTGRDSFGMGEESSSALDFIKIFNLIAPKALHGGGIVYAENGGLIEDLLYRGTTGNSSSVMSKMPYKQSPTNGSVIEEVSDLNRVSLMSYARPTNERRILPGGTRRSLADIREAFDPVEAFGYGAARSAGPTAAGITVGSHVTAATALPLGPFAPLAGLVAGIGAGLGTAFMQDQTFTMLAPGLEDYMNQKMAANPTASFLGGAAPGVGAGLYQQGIKSFAGTLGQRTLSGASGSAIGYGVDMVTGADQASALQNAAMNFGIGFAQPNIGAPKQNIEEGFILHHGGPSGLEGKTMKAGRKFQTGGSAGAYATIDIPTAESYAREVGGGASVYQVRFPGKPEDYLPLSTRFGDLPKPHLEAINQIAKELDLDLNSGIFQSQDNLAQVIQSAIKRKQKLTGTYSTREPYIGNIRAYDEAYGELQRQVFKPFSDRGIKGFQTTSQNYALLPEATGNTVFQNERVIRVGGPAAVAPPPPPPPFLRRQYGGVVYANDGMLVPYQPKGTDTVPAMLTPGEFVVNRRATQENLPLLRSINNGTSYLQTGGVAGGGVSTNAGAGMGFDFTQFNDSVKSFQENIASFNTTISNFGTYVDRLEKLNIPSIPDKIEMFGTHRVDVNVTGAAAFEAIEEGVRVMIDTKIGEKWNELWQKSNGQFGSPQR